jgi:hypothetical protein
MARFLTMQRSIVPTGDRKDFKQRMRDRKAHFERANCKIWTFEEVGLAGAIIEFIESADEASLLQALRSAPGSAGEHARIYKEMEHD